MSGGLYVVRLGSSERLERLLRYALEGREVTFLPPDGLSCGLHDARILFAVAVDALGVEESFLRTLRLQRGSGACLRGSTAAVIVDGSDDEIKAAVKAVMETMKGHRFILGADCTLPTEIDYHRIRTAVEAVK